MQNFAISLVAHLSMSTWHLLCAMVGCIRFFATPWTVPSQAPLSMGILEWGSFSPRILGFPTPQEYWDFPSPTQGSNPDLPHCRQILLQLSHQSTVALFE